MSRVAVILRGIRVRAVPDGDMGAEASCNHCVFKGSRGGCPTADGERAAGIQPCYHDDGHHYIEEEEDAQA